MMKVIVRPGLAYSLNRESMSSSVISAKGLSKAAPAAARSFSTFSMIFEKIQEINATGVAIVIVEQNAREALRMAHHGYVLAMGRNVLDDDGQALLANEEIGRLYLGG